MTSKFQIIRSETTRNIFRNPSAETNLRDYQGAGSGISRSVNEARFGRHSVRVFTNGIRDNEGVYLRAFPNTQGLPYAGSVYVRGRGRVRARLRDATNGIDRVSDPISLETAPDLPLPPCDPNHFDFNGVNSILNGGSDAALDDLPIGANGFTAEGWFLADSFGGAGNASAFNKVSWVVSLSAAPAIGMRVRIDTNAIDAFTDVGTDDWTADGEWHHIALTYEDTIARVVRVFFDGIEASYVAQVAATGAYVTDAVRDLIIGNNLAFNRAWDGQIGWIRISDFLRYTENFLPPGRCALPEIDINTVAQWIGVEADGEGDLVENQQGDPNLDGTIANATIDCECEDPERGRRWHRLEVIGQTGDQPSDDLRLYVETVGIQETAFYVDGAQAEQKTYVTTYIDGDQPGGRWNIERHGSESDRLSSERSGGRLIDLDEEELGLFATITSGIGMPPVRHNVQGRALQAGVEFQSTKVLPRVIQLTLWTCNNPQTCPGALERLHEVRQDLIDIIKPDRVDPDQHFTIRYNGGAVPMEIDALYEAGLQFDGDVRNQFFNSFVVRFLVTDPFWREDNQHVAILDPLEVLSVQNGLMAKVNEEWTNLGLVDNRILGSAIGPDGNYYVTGDFTVIGGVGANGIAGYDGTDWFPLGAGLNLIAGPAANPTGIVIVFGPDGSLYVGGNFNDAGGIANTIALARWDFATEAWNSVGGGVDNTIFGMAFAPNGSLFVGGDLTLGDPAGAPVTLTRVGEWTGTAWRALVDTGAGLGEGLNGAALEIAVSGSGQVYIGGDYTSAGGVLDSDMITRWNPDDQTFNSVGGDGDNPIKALAIDQSGLVYAGGTFTDIGGVSLNRAAVWNGSSWSQLGGGVDDEPRWIFVATNNRVIYVGDFTEALDSSDIGVPNTDHIAIWDGSLWTPEEVTVPTNLTRMRTVVTNGIDRFYGGEGALGNALVSSQTDILSLASANSFPIIFFKRTEGTSAIIILVLNEDTTREMKLTFDMSDGEEVEIDFRPGERTVKSSLFASSIDVAEALQNRLSAVVPGSDFASWALIPGENTVSIFVTIVGNAAIENTMRWIPQHWSADAVEL